MWCDATVDNAHKKKNTSTHTYCHMDLLQNRPKRTKITKWWCWGKNMPNAISQIKPNQYQLLRLCRRFVYFWLSDFLHWPFSGATLRLPHVLLFYFGSAVVVCHEKRFAGVARTLQNSIEIYGIKFVSFHLFNVRVLIFRCVLVFE